MFKFLTGLIIPVFGILFILYFHFNVHVDTMLNQWNEQDKSAMYNTDQQALKEAVEYHTQEPAFARRPLSTFLFKHASTYLHIEVGTSFIIVSFFLLFLCGFTLYFLCLQLSLTIAEAICSQFLFYSGFTILFAFFNTNYTYDEPLTYLCLFLSLLTFFKKQWVLFFLCYLLSCLCRESSYLLAPVFVFLFARQTSQTESIKEMLLFITGIAGILLIHAAFLWMVYPAFFSPQSQQEMSSRMNLFDFNFQDIKYARETIFSFFLVSGFPLYLLVQYRQDIKKDAALCDVFKGFLFLFIVNILIVVFSTIARESRLFALPLLLLYPLLGRYFLKEIKGFCRFTDFTLKIPQLMVILLHMGILWLAYWYFFTVYETTIHPKQFNYNCEYLFAMVLVMVLFNVKFLLTKKRLALPRTFISRESEG